MRSRTLLSSAALLTARLAFVPIEAEGRDQTRARRPASMSPLAASQTPGQAARQLGLTPAPFHLFVLITNPDGTAVSNLNSTADPLYRGWCDLYGFGAGGQLPSSGTGPTGGKPTLNALTLNRAVDATTTTLCSRLVKGQPANFTFVVVRDAPDRIESWKIKCTQAYVGSQQFSSGPEMSEVDTLVFTTVEWSYLDTDATGKVLDEIYTGYNVTSNTATNGTRVPTYPGGADTDGDGIPDGWELYYGFNPRVASDAQADLDGDGQNNLQEFLAGTVPNDPRSVLRMSAVSRTTANGAPAVTLTWNSVANKVYLVQSAKGPAGPWTTVTTVPSADNGSTVATLNVPADAATFFYRVIVKP